MNIKKLSPQNRPRERLIEFGKSALSDAELLAILLEKGYDKKNALEIAHDLLSKYSIEELSGLNLNELRTIYGIGQVKAMKIIVSFELSKRNQKAKRFKETFIINSPKDVYKFFVDEVNDFKKEHFYTLMLDSKNEIIGKELISIGTLNSSLIHPREIFSSAIRNYANSIILVHNHPSGNVEPSKEDILVTSRIKDAGNLLGITVLDHVIIGKDAYFSV